MKPEYLYYAEEGKPIKVFYEEPITQGDHISGKLVFIGEVWRTLHQGEERASLYPAPVGYFPENLMALADWLKGFERIWKGEKDECIKRW